MTAKWEAANQRRVALIEKQFSSGLTEQERHELQRLQQLADKQVEALDAQRLRSVEQMEARAREVLRRTD